MLEIRKFAWCEQDRGREKDEHTTITAAGKSDRFTYLCSIRIIGEDHRPDSTA
jgi:hypothetical protein